MTRIPHTTRRTRIAGAAATALLLTIGALATAGQTPPPAGQTGGRGRGGAFQGPIDETRARQLYVSNRFEDHARPNFQAAMDAKAREDARYTDACAGVLECTKVTYRSTAGDMDIPAYLFQPLTKGSARSHAAMIWVHGGVHGNWSISYFPFVKEAVARGYVVIAPEYRGSTGYGEAHHMAIDYGGKEVDDVMSAYDYLGTLPHVDPDRVGMMGWSHGGYITLLSVFRDQHPFKAAAAIVPVTNLFFRLSFKGPSYQRQFATQKDIQGLPFEKREVYIARSPIFHVDKLQVPLLVHVATNDDDVNFEENQQIIDALRARKPALSETKIYVDPVPGPTSRGHTFSRRTNTQTLTRDDSPDQIDSWNRTWTFFEWNLRKKD
jgi:dipeptidyl aminopeptidase/acylaminoacyl peptidase